MHRERRRRSQRKRSKQVEEKEIAEERKKKVTRFSFGFVGISFL